MGKVGFLEFGSLGVVDLGFLCACQCLCVLVCACLCLIVLVYACLCLIVLV